MVPNQKVGGGGTVGSGWWDFAKGRGTLVKFRNHFYLAITLLVYCCLVERSRQACRELYVLRVKIRVKILEQL